MEVQLVPCVMSPGACLRCLRACLMVSPVGALCDVAGCLPLLAGSMSMCCLPLLAGSMS